MTRQVAEQAVEKADRVVVVTGGARGIGRAICTAFARKNTCIYLNYSASAGAAAETVEQIQSKGGTAMAIRADVACEKEVKAFFKTVIDRSGKVDVLVNNAGISRDGLIPRMKEADWDAVLDVNLKGAFFCIKAVSRQMLKQRYGRIINISSIVGLSGNAGQSNYTASKAGLIGLTKAVATELASRNITVNAVAPGLIQTDMADDLADDARKKIVEMIPLGRPGTPDDVAEAVVFLASPGADYITGQVLSINGGLYM